MSVKVNSNISTPKLFTDKKYDANKMYICIYSVHVSFICMYIDRGKVVHVTDPRFIQFALGSCYAAHINTL